MSGEDKDDDLAEKIAELMSEESQEDEDFGSADFDEDLALNTPEEQIEALEAQRDEYRDRFMRALADSENMRKRSERDRREAEKYGGSRLARDLLSVYDNLTRALGAISEEQKEENAALVEGVELTLKELVSVFGKHGVETITPEVGEKFDPQLHQAMFEAPLPDTKKDDIIQVMADGFMLHDRLLRPAQVGLSSNPEK